MKTPPFIAPGDTIGITAPSFGATTEPYKTRFKEAVKILKSMGYKIKIGSTCKMHNGLGISTKPEVAAKELEEFYLDKEVKAIISCGGGELMCETVSALNWEKIKNAPPKWFMGYSDNTNFIFPLVTKCNVPAIYGHCITGFGKPWEQCEKDNFALLTGEKLTVSGYSKFQDPNDGTEKKEENPLSPYILTKKKILKTFLPEENGSIKKASSDTKIELNGTLLGGCLDVLYGLSGTPLEDVKKYKAKHKNIIWVLEACDYNPMDIRRAVWHLDQCGWFTDAKGFIIGRPLAAWKQNIMGVDQYNAVTDILKKYKMPIIMDADVGHIAPSMPVIMGLEANVSVKGNSISIEKNMRIP